MCAEMKKQEKLRGRKGLVVGFERWTGHLSLEIDGRMWLVRLWVAPARDLCRRGQSRVIQQVIQPDGSNKGLQSQVRQSECCDLRASYTSLAVYVDLRGQ